MSHKKTSSSSTMAYQPQQQTPRAQDQRITLIRNVRKHPRLYKSEFLHTPFLHRHEKQQIWDKIAQESGFEKTEDAKCKWRSLINYLRQHLDSVAQRKLRRYIPVTENPEDKYVQLTDWSFYKELEFVVPYVKYVASKQNNNGGGGGNHMEISANEIDLILEGLEGEVDKGNEQQEKLENDVTLLELEQELAKEEDKKEEKQANENSNLMLLVNSDNNLTDDDIILKEYFENMLKSTLKLPRFHQNRVRQKLLDCVNEQKNLNKIN